MEGRADAGTNPARQDQGRYLGQVIWINLDPASGSLRDYLEPAACMLDPFELQNMRCRWRRWLVFNCNWKVAMEAFAETYHVPGRTRSS